MLYTIGVIGWRGPNFLGKGVELKRFVATVIAAFGLLGIMACDVVSSSNRFEYDREVYVKFDAECYSILNANPFSGLPVSVWEHTVSYEDYERIEAGGDTGSTYAVISKGDLRRLEVLAENEKNQYEAEGVNFRESTVAATLTCGKIFKEYIAYEAVPTSTPYRF